MGYIYSLINKENEKKFLGKSNLEKHVLKKLLYQALRKENHYNDLLQKEFKKYTFELEFQESNNVTKDFDSIIKEEELLNPICGYNVFNDLQNKKGRGKKKEIYTEDLCLLYLFNPKVQYWANVLNLERNTISNRLGNFGLFNDGYYYQSIARYEDFYYMAIRLLYLEDRCLPANTLLDMMMNRYDISSQLRITPRKISKFFAAHGVKRKEEKVKGSLVFCPGRRDDV